MDIRKNFNVGQIQRALALALSMNRAEQVKAPLKCDISDLAEEIANQIKEDHRLFLQGKSYFPELAIEEVADRFLRRKATIGELRRAVKAAKGE